MWVTSQSSVRKSSGVGWSLAATAARTQARCSDSAKVEGHTAPVTNADWSMMRKVPQEKPTNRRAEEDCDRKLFRPNEEVESESEFLAWSMWVPFFGPSPLLANGFYIFTVRLSGIPSFFSPLPYTYIYFFVLATKLGPGQRENPLTVKWISQFMSFEFNFVTLATALAPIPAPAPTRFVLFSLWPSSLGTFKWICFALLVSFSFSFGLLPNLAVASAFDVWQWCWHFWAKSF